MYDMAKKSPHTVSIYVRVPESVYDAICTAAFHRGYPHTKTSVASEALVKHFSPTNRGAK